MQDTEFKPIPVRLKDEFIGYMHHAYHDDDAPDGAWFAAMENDARDFMRQHKLRGDENYAVHQLLDWMGPPDDLSEWERSDGQGS